MNFSAYKETYQRLIGFGIPSPRMEARLLIGHVLNISPDNVSDLTTLNTEQHRLLENLLEQRKQHKPLDKILGQKEFYKYNFITNEDVLSPRPETEILVEAAIDLCQNNPSPEILDLGTGSGCILCSLIKELPAASGIGIDKSAKALKTAERNAQKLDIEKRCRWICANWFEPEFLSIFKNKFDLITTNPPYIPSSDIQHLDKEVRDFDPRAALDGGEDGLDSYRRIATLAGHLLKDKGFLLIEIGISQSQEVEKLFKEQGFFHIRTLNDLANIPRCIIFSKKDCN